MKKQTAADVLAFFVLLAISLVGSIAVAWLAGDEEVFQRIYKIINIF